MTEAAPGATAIIEAPLTPEAAADRMAQLKEDPAFQERVAKRDPAAFEEHLKLWRVAHGLPETPQPPQSLVDVSAEADARVVAQAQRHAAALAAQGFSDSQQIQIIGRRPVPQAEHDIHVREYERLRKDAAFMQRWVAGDTEAVFTMRKHAIGKSLPIGSLDDIRAW